MSSTILARHLREAIHINRHGPILWPALRAFLSVLTPLLVLLGLDRLDLVAGAVFGALTSVYCRSEPYRNQTRSLAAVAAGMVIAVGLGDAIALADVAPWQHRLLVVTGTAVVGAVATAATTAVKLGAPGGLIFSFATGACANLAITPADVAPQLAVCAVSGAFAWLICTVGAAFAGLRPQRRAVASALEATAAYLSNRSDVLARHRSAVAVETAWTRLALVGGRQRDTAEHQRLIQTTEICEVLGGSGRAASETIRSLRETAAGIRKGDSPASPGYAREESAAVPALPPSRWCTIRGVLLAAVRPGKGSGSWLVPFALRVGIAALLAGVLADLLDTGHIYWAGVSAVSVLQATSTSRSVPRMLQRVAGTVGGVLLGLVLLSLHPAVWVIILLLAALQWAVEATMPVNYAFGLLFATPVALLVSGMMTQTSPAQLVSSRLWATLLGAAVAVLVAWLAPHGAWLARLRDSLARVRELTELPRTDPERLRKALIELHDAYETAAGEVPESQLPTEELLAVSRDAYKLLDGGELSPPARRGLLRRNPLQGGPVRG
ncbi:Fusaric acid resistance protein-like [Actinopolyspora alba]|uniref:Fusaric acid resistance protein-like n=1 Tax=Actinopolyspora alba TaxID=673379 RepID=A0A1I2C697_9ACTN|nr:FUSC family protein [Actinopolyspora alba]SFE63160.1 Fusaric acid resistance protein-like [Actinopolyspora alba]